MRRDVERGGDVEVDEGDLAVGPDVAELAAGDHGVAADEDVAGLLIEERTDRVVLGCAARVHGGEARQRLALRIARGNGRVDERGNERSAVELRPSDDQAAGRRVGYRDGRQPLGEGLDE
jgi:hypothetical protein